MYAHSQIHERDYTCISALSETQRVPYYMNLLVRDCYKVLEMTDHLWTFPLSDRFY